MLKITPVNSMIIVEPQSKAKKDSGDPWSPFETSKNLGVVKYSEEKDYPVGMHIYFGATAEPIVINGANLIAMPVTNIIARIVDFG